MNGCTRCDDAGKFNRTLFGRRQIFRYDYRLRECNEALQTAEHDVKN